MKEFMMTLLCALVFSLPSFAQGINDKADNIVGEYLTDRGGSKSKVRVTKNADGTYSAQVFWVEKPYDAKGNKRKDVKNPDKSLRNVDIDQVVIVKGLKYDAEDKTWGDAKIYDPSKGIRVNVTAEFVEANKLKLRGTIFGIGTTLYWTRIQKFIFHSISESRSSMILDGISIIDKKEVANQLIYNLLAEREDYEPNSRNLV